MTNTNEEVERIVSEIGNPEDWTDRDGITEFSELKKFQELLRSLLTNFADKVRGKLMPYIEHDNQCIRSQFEAGQPTKDGGYEEKYAGKWYQTTPIDETPKCDCGLDEVLASLTNTGKETNT